MTTIRINGRQCEYCSQAKVDVRYASDVLKWLCNLCWVDWGPHKDKQSNRIKGLL